MQKNQANLNCVREGFPLYFRNARVATLDTQGPYLKTAHDSNNTRFSRVNSKCKKAIKKKLITPASYERPGGWRLSTST